VGWGGAAGDDADFLGDPGVGGGDEVEAGGGGDAAEETGGEMGAVIGDQQHVGVLAAVGHFEDQESSRLEAGVESAEEGEGGGDVFENVDERDRVEGAGDGVEFAGVEAFDAGDRFDFGAVFVADFGAGEGPAGDEAAPGGEERTVAAAEVEQASVVGEVHGGAEGGDDLFGARPAFAAASVEDALFGAAALVVDGVSGVDAIGFGGPLGGGEGLDEAAGAAAGEDAAGRPGFAIGSDAMEAEVRLGHLEVGGAAEMAGGGGHGTGR
jgi:hypothetical protein